MHASGPRTVAGDGPTAGDGEVSPEHVAAIAAEIQDVLWSYSPVEDRVLYLHPAAARTHGRPVAELIADTAAWREAVHPEDRERFAACLERAFADGEAELVYRVVRPDGEQRWLHDRVRRAGEAGAACLVGLARDITEGKRAAAGAELMQAIVATVSEGISVSDARGRCVLFNPQMEAITGYTRAETERPGLFSRLFPDRTVRRAAVAQFVQALRGADLVNQDWRITRKDRGQRDILISTRILGGGPQRHLLAAVRDVTDKREAEEARWAVERRFREAERLESLGVMAGGIAHDFNNLLQTILGFADLAAAAVGSDSAAAPALAQVQAAGQRAAELTRQMLAYAGRTRFVPRVVDLAQVVARAEPLLRASLRPGQALAVEAATRPAAVDADPAQVRQVLVNLVANASEALGEHGGRIVLRTGRAACDPAYLAGCYPHDELPAGDYAFLEVEDDGCGMPDDIRSRLFDPFFSTKFTGRGLGLAAVLGIVRGHRGAIDVASAPLAGTRMRVLLPATV